MSQDGSEQDQRHCNRGISLPYLRELRQSRGLSQKELGELARVSSGTVYRLENGLRGAYPGTVRKLAAALGIAPEALLYGTSLRDKGALVQRAPKPSIPTSLG
jgi:transcriptional regulator with XRE-family HTH domain